MGVGGSSLLYISIAYYMQKEGEGVQIACEIAYVINGRPQLTVRRLRLVGASHCVFNHV